MRKDKQSWKDFFCDTKKNWWLPFLGITVLWLVCWYLFSVWGKTGDNTFDAISSLFSGLAFAGIIITTLMQYEELKLQRRDLELTRKEIQGQREELEQQNKTLILQRFENSFFNILSQHNEMMGKLNIGEFLGKNAIKAIMRGSIAISFSLNALLDLVLNSKARDKESICGIVNEYYEGIYRHYYSFFGVYFRSLYRIFIFIDNSKIDNKTFYADIVRSQLSDDEIVILFINGLSQKGEKFKEYIEKYALLNNLPIDKIKPEMKGLYSESAYGE